jgi:hypothetical protein
MKIVLALVVTCLLVPAVQASPTTFACNPTEVAAFDNRIHVLCSPTAGAIGFFAVSTANPDKAARFQDLATKALLNNKVLVIFFDPFDLSGGAFGCNTANCRNATGVLLRK